jgi:hypothetical protein
VPAPAILMPLRVRALAGTFDRNFSTFELWVDTVSVRSSSKAEELIMPRVDGLHWKKPQRSYLYRSLQRWPLTGAAATHRKDTLVEGTGRSLLSLAANTKVALLLRGIGWGSAYRTALPYSNWVLEY